MNIERIKKFLLQANADALVYFDFCDCVPLGISSWRGKYDEPAIGWSPSGYSGNGKAPTAKEFLCELDLATSGMIYTGWKSGDFSYTEQSVLHVDNPGEYTNTEIISVEIGEHQIVLHTACSRDLY
jgi:hypothetical protein